MSDDRWCRIEELYHAALALPPDERAAFIAESSGADSELGYEVEALLAQQRTQDSIFDQPAWAELSPDDASALRTPALLGEGTVLGPYSVTGFLGAGGMGQVYRAHDSRLHRSVAIKVLFPEQDVHQFEREARVLAALSHPNIVPIFDVGHNGGVDYLVEELVDGEPLCDVLRRGPLEVVRFRHLALQISDGLAAAHRAGIIHRDLKPGNIMITRDDCVRILDFGLATRYRAGPNDASISLPHLGAAGTAAYMSPEQVRGTTIDPRSDIFSYGSLLYEMITGRQAFARDTIPATLAAVLEDEPVPVGEIVPCAPRELVEIIHRCLCKDPNRRFQTIDEVRIAIHDQEKAEPAVLARPYWWAALGGTLALVVGLAIGGWLLYSRKPPALTNKDTIVVADFANSTGDAVFDDTLKEGLAVQLGQSSLLNMLPEQKVRSTLREMTRAPDEPLTATLAQEVCERTSSKAYIAGSIANLGGHYVIGVNAVNCATGDGLAREQTEAADKQQVIAALGSVARRLRKKLGESLNSIQRFDVPLAQATTSSLEALKAYSVGLSKFAKGESADAARLFQKAVELDPDFAVAYANLGRAYQVQEQQANMDRALRRAFALRNRASEREKYDISSVYYQFITNQTDDVIQNCELWARTYPQDFTPHRVLGYEYGVLGRPDKSAEEFQKAKQLDPTQALPYAGLMFGYMALNRLGDAHAIYQESQARKLHFGVRPAYLLAFLEGNQEMMKVTAATSDLQEEPRTEAFFGHLGHARQLWQRTKDAALGKGDKEAAAGIEANWALQEELSGDSPRARLHAASALRLGGRPPAASLRAGDAVQPVVALAIAGDLVLAAKVADRLSSDMPASGVTGTVWLPEIRAAIALKRGDPGHALQLLELVRLYEAGWSDNFLAAYLRGEAYVAERRGHEATAEFQKIIDHRGVVLNSPIGALAHLEVARSFALEGDITKARLAYQDFLTLWKDADPDIPILIAAKSEYAKLK